MRIPLAIAAFIALAACEHPGTAGPPGSSLGGAPGAPQALIVTESPSYSPGSAIEFRLVNRTGRTVGYNLCRSRLERRSGDGDWEIAMQSLAEVCTAELRALPPGQTARYAFRPGMLRRGEYRISTDLEDFSARRRLLAVSNSFSVSRDE